MANASVDKLKTFGLRHGEKVVVGLTAVACVAFLALAATKPTIDITPAQVDKDAKAADSNLNRRQDPDDILKRIEEAGIKNPNFEKMVDAQAKDLLVAANYKASHDWVFPQPGAGLIRDMPELIAPADLYAYPGRGGALLYALNENGERIPDESEEAKAKGLEKAEAKALKKLTAKQREKLKKEQEELDAAQRKKLASLSGDAKAKAEKEAQETSATEGPFKELTKGLRWASVTGTIDYKKLRENYVNALKRPDIGYPHFKQLDVERQTKQSDGTWSDWEPLDAERNLRVLNNMPEEEEELTPEAVRFEALVDPLPFLKAGFWERVHVASLVDKEKIEAPAPVAVPSGSGMNAMMSSSAMSSSMPGMQIRPGMSPSEGMMSSSAMSSRMTMGSGMIGSMGAMGAGGGDRIDFQTSTEDTLMVRALDFTVEPEKTYRYRTRFVVFNPNKDREDVSPGVDSRSAELNGPWSEPTEEVSIPGDVATYALKKAIDMPNKLEQVHFQVARWLPDDGVTVVKEFDAGPGGIIGSALRVPVPIQNPLPPNRKGDEPPKLTAPPALPIDFNSREIVLDALGGGSPRLPSAFARAGLLDIPVISMLVRADGTLVIRDEATDATDEVRKDIASSAKRSIEDWKAPTANSNERDRGTGPGSSSMPR